MSTQPVLLNCQVGSRPPPNHRLVRAPPDPWRDPVRNWSHQEPHHEASSDAEFVGFPLYHPTQRPARTGLHASRLVRALTPEASWRQEVGDSSAGLVFVRDLFLDGRGDALHGRAAS